MPTLIRLCNSVCLCVYRPICLSVRTIKTKRLKFIIAKLGTEIVYHDTSPIN